MNRATVIAQLRQALASALAVVETNVASLPPSDRAASEATIATARAALALNDPAPPRIVITVDGGLVQSVEADEACSVLQLDYDTEGEEACHIMEDANGEACLAEFYDFTQTGTNLNIVAAQFEAYANDALIER